MEVDSDKPILAIDLIKIIEDSILTFRFFLKMDKKKSGGFFRAHSPRSSLQQVQASLEKVCYMLVAHVCFVSTWFIVLPVGEENPPLGCFPREESKLLFPFIGVFCVLKL